MDNPIFRIEGIVQNKNEETLQDFEGPLDLILSLLNKNKIEIQNIPIALILDQYLEYLEQRKKLDLEIASEFITMAAQLMYIKSRMLLPLGAEEVQGDVEELIRSLEEQKRQQMDVYLNVKRLTETMSAMSEFGRNTMTRGPEPVERGSIFKYDHEREDLVRAMKAVLDRSEMLAPPDTASFSEIVRREPYPVTNKTQEIINLLKKTGITRFLLLFHGNRTRSEIVATFLAVLELCREKLIKLAGSDAEYTVEYDKNAPESPAV
ncbi:MAG: segregation/condensation protein A [Oscillospiraceae bacterium]|nr:segregation/condensation protein A [Oscillospiraceae bacterium]